MRTWASPCSTKQQLLLPDIALAKSSRWRYAVWRYAVRRGVSVSWCCRAVLETACLGAAAAAA
jgi:hypothetical protein